MSDNIEKIICSAYYIDGAIIVGKRHNNCLFDMHKAGIKAPPSLPEMSWFYTNKFRYVDRIEWLEIAKKANQIINPDAKYRLYSEDLR